MYKITATAPTTYQFSSLQKFGMPIKKRFNGSFDAVTAHIEEIEQEFTIFKTIEIDGYLSEKEVAQGKTAIWTENGIETILDYNIDDYCIDDSKIDIEIVRAQSFLDSEVQKNGWIITPIARVVIHQLPLN